MADGGTIALRRTGRPQKGDVVTRYADDVGAQRLVALHPDGVPLELIGEHLGLSRESARLIAEAALRSLAPRLALAGIDAADFADMLAARHGAHHEPDHGDLGKQSSPARERREELAIERIGTGAQSPDVLALYEGLDSIRETAAAHRFVERVVCGMEDGGEMRVLDSAEAA